MSSEMVLGIPQSSRAVLKSPGGPRSKGDALDNFLSGNAGNDTLIGVGGNNILIGGPGNDKITGADGRDLIFGGLGRDTLKGGDGEDMLLSGPTTFESNRRALDALFTFWNRQDLEFGARVAQLRRGVRGVPALNGRSVLQDDARDVLSGGNGLDWHFAKMKAPAKDVITDLEAGEARN